jgi:hypothetical protein
VRDYAAAVRAHNLQYVTLPMIEMAAPDDFDDAAALVSDCRRRIEGGEVLAVGGLAPRTRIRPHAQLAFWSSFPKRLFASGAYNRPLYISSSQLFHLLLRVNYEYL